MSWNALSIVQLAPRGPWAVPVAVCLWCRPPFVACVFGKIENDNGRPVA